jgi:hypothetical protein
MQMTPEAASRPVDELTGGRPDASVGDGPERDTDRSEEGDEERLEREELERAADEGMIEQRPAPEDLPLEDVSLPEPDAPEEP